MKKIKKMKIWFILILFASLTIFVISFISGYFSSRVKYYIAQKVKVHSSFLLEQAIREAVIPFVDTDTLINISYGSEGQIESVLINTKEVNVIMSHVLQVLQNNLKEIEAHDELHQLTLPLGIILSDTLFPRLGPNITVDIEPVASFTVDIATSAQPFGINNSLLQVMLITNIEFITIVPFNKQSVLTSLRIPLAIEMISGQVPRYYYYLHNANVGPTIPEID